jgi:hypothetical protein
MKTGEGFGGNAIFFTGMLRCRREPASDGRNGTLLEPRGPRRGRLSDRRPGGHRGQFAQLLGRRSRQRRSSFAHGLCERPLLRAAAVAACVGTGAVPGHPYMMPNMELLIYFTVDANIAKWHLSSDEMVPGAIARIDLPRRLLGSMVADHQGRWHAACINQALSCGGAAVDNQGAIAGGDMPWPNGFPKHQLVPLSCDSVDHKGPATGQGAWH